MKAFSHPEPGTELDWLAVDVDEYVGLFSTAGRGPVPVVVVEHLVEVKRAIARLGNLPILADCAKTPDRGTGDFSFWIEPCRRGLYGFDWGPVDAGPFARLTVPGHPIKTAELEEATVREAARLVRLPIRFAVDAFVNYDELGVLLHRDDASG